jgi:general secretion pathway protein G
MKRKNGFTLIELMVVIVILGILAAIIASRIPIFVTKAREGRTKGNLATLRSVLGIYYSDNDGKYPVTNALAGILVPKYLKEIPKAEMPPNHDASNSVTGDNGTAVVTMGDDGGWVYNYNGAGGVWGYIYPNCNAHADLAGVYWSSY